MDVVQPETLFSAVVPTYNRAHLIERTLRSLLDQTRGYHEIIVVDDGSTDNTEAAVRGVVDSRIRYYRKANAERAAARNFGARHVSGDYVNFFDSDDLALPNHLDEAAALVRLKARPGWFHLGYALASPDGRVLTKTNTYRGDTLQKYIPYGNPLSCNGVFLRRDIAALYPFNEDRALSTSEDYELWYRLAARFPLYFSNTITSYAIEHGERSVHAVGVEKLERRIQLLLLYLRQDVAIRERFATELKHTELELQTYLALHLSEHRGQRARSLALLCQAALQGPHIVPSRRFFATVRNIVARSPVR